MYLIINSECPSIPDQAKALVGAPSALLNLLLCLGYEAANPPLADLLRRAHQLEGNWLILSPIHWQASHNDALIVATGNDLGVQEDEAKSWFHIFEEYFAADGMTLYFHDSTTWLLHDAQNRPLQAKPAYQLINKPLMLELATMDASNFWQKLITESQMLFAAKSNATPMNGLWPWANALLGKKKEGAICVDPAFVTMAQECSSNVSIYEPTLRLKDFAIVLISDVSLLSQAHQEELNKMKVQWYWNNIAYTSGPRSWFLRLWRKLTHAH